MHFSTAEKDLEVISLKKYRLQVIYIDDRIKNIITVYLLIITLINQLF